MYCPPKTSATDFRLCGYKCNQISLACEHKESKNFTKWSHGHISTCSHDSGPTPRRPHQCLSFYLKARITRSDLLRGQVCRWVFTFVSLFANVVRVLSTIFFPCQNYGWQPSSPDCSHGLSSVGCSRPRFKLSSGSLHSSGDTQQAFLKATVVLAHSWRYSLASLLENVHDCNPFSYWGASSPISVWFMGWMEFL